MNAVYLTDATARELTIGNRKIIFKRSAPRIFAYKTDLFPLIYRDMKELGKDNVTDEQVAIIKQAIEKYGSPDEIKYDYSIAPQWIKKAKTCIMILLNLQKKNNLPFWLM